jgi:hypothetical protein
MFRLTINVTTPRVLGDESRAQRQRQGWVGRGSRPGGYRGQGIAVPVSAAIPDTRISGKAVRGAAGPETVSDRANGEDAAAADGGVYTEPGQSWHDIVPRYPRTLVLGGSAG